MTRPIDDATFRLGRPANLLTLEEVERVHIARVLGLAGGNLSRAADWLGIDRKTLSRKLARLI